jgi:fibronectin type 3 domain-containing protein
MKTILFIAGLLSCLSLTAQQTMPNVAVAGAKGIFVVTGETISDVKGPVTAYRIERKAGNEKDFAVVATLAAVPDVTTFKKNLAQSVNLLPYAPDLSVFRTDSIWTRGKRAGKLAALRNVGYTMPVLAGFNMIWLDEKVKAGQTYQYKVTAVGDTYSVNSYPVVFKAPVVASIQYTKGVYNLPQHYLSLEWIATQKNKPVFMEAYRTETNGRFVKVAASISLLTKKDTFQYVIKDTTAQPSQLYRYYVKAYDAYGNEAPLSDTISIASLDYVQMPLPTQVKAISDSAQPGIHISWHQAGIPLIKSLTLYRSTSSVKGFEPIAILSPADSVYMDQQVQPATPYFYYFEAIYKMQDKPKRSTAFAASFIDHSLPGAPQQLQATGNKQGVALSWQSTEPHVSGFWLYRAERGQPLKLITTMIAALPGTSDYTYTDTDSLLNGGRSYQYALKAFSTSHVESLYSDTVVARPLKNIPVPKPPMQIQVSKEQGLVLVTWDAVSKYDELVNGYLLLRGKKVAGAKASFITDTVYCTNNIYKDTLVKPNESYRYSVISRSLLGVQSVPATWVSVNMPGNKPAPPASLTANPVKTGVQLNWETADTGETLAYNVYRYERGKEPVKAGSINGADKYTDTGAAKGKQYFYFVRAVGQDKTESEKSNEAVINY